VMCLRSPLRLHFVQEDNDWSYPCPRRHGRKSNSQLPQPRLGQCTSRRQPVKLDYLRVADHPGVTACWLNWDAGCGHF